MRTLSVKEEKMANIRIFERLPTKRIKCGDDDDIFE